MRAIFIYYSPLTRTGKVTKTQMFSLAQPTHPRKTNLTLPLKTYIYTLVQIPIIPPTQLKGSGTPAFGREGSLGGAFPILGVFYFRFTVSTTARSEEQNSLRPLLASPFSVLVSPAVAGVFRFSPPPLLFVPLLLPTACSLSRARYATDSDGSSRVFL